MKAKQFYRTVARRHRLFYEDWPQLVRQEGAWLDSILRPLGARTVLDCTCGIGTQALGLALHDYEVTATDLSAENLAEAQRGARELGVSVAWHQADVRRLYEAPIAGPFDAVLSLGNSLPHLLTERDMQQALRQMYDQARIGGALLVGQRDWQDVQRRRPAFNFRHEHLDTPEPGQRTIVFDLWHYEDPVVIFEVFFLEQSQNGWRVENTFTHYRMWRQDEFIDLMELAGLADIRPLEHPWELRYLALRPD